MQWKTHGHLLTVIVVLHYEHIMGTSSRMTTTSFPQTMFVQPGKHQGQLRQLLGNINFGVIDC